MGNKFEFLYHSLAICNSFNHPNSSHLFDQIQISKLDNGFDLISFWDKDKMKLAKKKNKNMRKDSDQMSNFSVDSSQYQSNQSELENRSISSSEADD